MVAVPRAPPKISRAPVGVYKSLQLKPLLLFLRETVPGDFPGHSAPAGANPLPDACNRLGIARKLLIICSR